jgi:hypothetical protein
MVKTSLTLSMNDLRLHPDPRRFGRRQPFAGEAVAVRAAGMSDDLKLFALTYAAGFLFVSLFIA